MLRFLLILVLALGACNRKPATPAVDARASQLEKENQELRAALDQRNREIAALRDQQPVKTAPPLAALKRERLIRVDDSATIQQLRDALVESNSQNSDLQVRLEKLEGELAASKAESAPLQSALAEARQKLQAAQADNDAAHQSFKEKSERLSQLEAANRKLRDAAAAQAQRNDQLARTLAELEDLDRRRENALAALLRRYRDVAEQYRALGGGPERGAELARVNEALNLAEEDLRQFRALNAQTQRAQKKLSAAK